MPTGTDADLTAPKEPATPAPADHTIPTVPLLPDTPEERPHGLRLTARVALGTATLLVATIGLALVVATWRADTHDRRVLPERRED